jgi:hypothetical protein
VESQQLATKLTQLEGRVATLEDENKIVKGEVKQILTEIRSAILVRDNPFDNDGTRKAPQLNIVARSPEPVTKVELVMPPEHHDAPPEPTHARVPAPVSAPTLAPADAPASHGPSAAPPQPVVLRSERGQPVETVTPEPKPQWSLLTIAALSAWSEEAMRRIGALRLEILLDLCEAAGHISADARQALSRVTDLDIDEPSVAPGQNETASMLRQLEAVLTDESDTKVQRSA